MKSDHLKEREIIMRGIAGALIVCLLGFSQLAVADETSSRALAEDLMVVMNVDKRMKEMMALVKEMQINQMKQLYPSDEGGENSAEFMGSIMDMMSEDLSWDKLKDEYITIYVETFTEEELRETVAFYKSPVGQAWIEKSPMMTRKIMEISQSRTQAMLPRIKQRIKQMSNKLMERLKKKAEALEESESDELAE